MEKENPKGYYKGLRRKENIPIDEVYEAVKDVMFEKDKRKSMVLIRGDRIKGNSHRF